MTFDPNTHARPSDPDTSHEAAAKLSTFGKHCRTLLEEFGRQAGAPGWQGLTAEEVAHAVGLEPWAVSKRVSDLRHLGLIAWWSLAPGVIWTRHGTAHRKQRVYNITQRGLDVLAHLAKAKP